MELALRIDEAQDHPSTMLIALSGRPVRASHSLSLRAPRHWQRVLDATLGRPAPPRYCAGAVNFLRHGTSVLVRTSRGAKLTAACRGDIVAFQADHIDHDSHTGWSVLIVGHATVINDVDQLVAVLDI